MIKTEDLKEIYGYMHYGKKHLEFATSCENDEKFGDASIWYNKAYEEFCQANNITGKDNGLKDLILEKIAFCSKKIFEMEEKYNESKREVDDFRDI